MFCRWFGIHALRYLYTSIDYRSFCSAFLTWISCVEGAIQIKIQGSEWRTLNCSWMFCGLIIQWPSIGAYFEVCIQIIGSFYMNSRRILTLDVKDFHGFPLFSLADPHSRIFLSHLASFHRRKLAIIVAVFQPKTEGKEYRKVLCRSPRSSLEATSRSVLWGVFKSWKLAHLTDQEPYKWQLGAGATLQKFVFSQVGEVL